MTNNDWDSSSHQEPKLDQPERATEQTAKPVMDAKAKRTLARFMTGSIGLLGASAAVFVLKTGLDSPDRLVPEDQQAEIAVPIMSDAARLASIKTLEEQLTQAAWGDFDAIKRDELARSLVALSTETKPIRDLEATLHRAGAWEVLMETPPPHQKPWFDVNIRLGTWDRLRAMDSPSANEQVGTRALCMAGDEAAALRIYQQHFKSALESPDGIACGLNDQTADQVFRGASVPPQSVGIAASRNAVDLRILFDRITQETEPDNPALMDLAAVLYLDGKISDHEMAKWAFRSVNDCSGMPRGRDDLSEPVAPTVLFAAADKLAASSLPDDGGKTRAVENLNIGAVLAGLFQLKDTRRGFNITTRENKICFAQAEFEFEPEAATKRLVGLLSTHNPSLQLMAAIAAAHSGDFKTAFARTKTARMDAVHYKLTHLNVDWFMMAFAHRLGRLDEVKLTQNGAEATAILAALRGTKALTPDQLARFDGAELRLPLEVVFYLRGALAQGHEETAADGMIDAHGSVSSYLRARAESANWRGDVAAAKKWSDRRQALHLRAAEGKFGGHHLLWTH